MRLYASFTCVIVLLWGCVGLLDSVVGRSTSNRMLWFSDIHYEPWYGTPNCTYVCNSSSFLSMPWTRGCDSPLHLVNSFFDDARRQNFSFLLFGGDLQRHCLLGRDSAPLLEEVFVPMARNMAELAGHAVGAEDTPVSLPIALTLGNGDWFCFKTRPANNTESFEYYLPLLHELQASRLLPAPSDTLERCAFYAKATPYFRVITLNTLLWSPFSTLEVHPEDRDPCGQFDFLVEELRRATAAGQRVIVVGHIPPIFNVEALLRSRRPTQSLSEMARNPTNLWYPHYVERYVAILNEYKSVVVTHLYGHMHSFSVIAFEDLEVPGFVLPSISPVYDSQPAYLVVDFTESWELNSIRQRFLGPNDTWRTGLAVEEVLSMTSSYRDMDALRSSLRRMRKVNMMFKHYLRFSVGSYTDTYDFVNGCNESCQDMLLCSMLSHEVEGFRACLGNSGVRDYRVWGPTVGSLIVSLTLLFVLLLLFFRRFFRSFRGSGVRRLTRLRRSGL